MDALLRLDTTPLGVTLDCGHERAATVADLTPQLLCHCYVCAALKRVMVAWVAGTRHPIGVDE